MIYTLPYQMYKYEHGLSAAGCSVGEGQCVTC